MSSGSPSPSKIDLVLAHHADSRPAWLFAADGGLIWRNAAAAYFLAKAKKHKVRVAEPAQPIKGQIARVLRLGNENRTSLSRIQFQAGDKPGSATCACTVLSWIDGRLAVFIVGVDPIDGEVLASGAADFTLDESLFARGALYDGVAFEADDLKIYPHVGAAPIAFDTADAITPNSDHPADADAETVEPPPPEADGRLSALMDRLMEDDQLFTPLTPSDDPPEPEPGEPDDVDQEDLDELAKLDGETDEADDDLEDLVRLDAVEAIGEDVVETTEDEEDFDHLVRLDGVAEFETTDADDDLDDIARLDEVEHGPIEPVEKPRGTAETPQALFRIIGRYLRRAGEEPPRDPTSDAGNPDTPDVGPDPGGVPDDLDLAQFDPVPAKDIADDPDGDFDAAADQLFDADLPAIFPPADDLARDADAVDRVSRYNFDELSRILTDRVGDMGAQAQNQAEAARLADAPSGSILARGAAPGGELINLGGETLVLNRLPLGILVFRDQQVLFANRAITEMVGYDTVESLRGAGLAAIFPGNAEDGAGPVNHLVQRDGTLVPVTARLQSISWQGRPALMLSASTTEVRTSHEDAVRAFAAAFAETRGDGFFELTRAGVVSAMNAKSVATLDLIEAPPLGKPISDYVSQRDLPELREFLERPARFAETSRPALQIKASAPDAELQVFAQGQAGVITGYFGFVHAMAAPRALPALTGPVDPDAALLSRLSRGVRRPLNTIIGFSDILGSGTFGAIEDERYAQYAEDIKTAGHEIAALVDELDDYARLKDGRYLPQRATIDLLGLLESCVLRIRRQAGLKRVIVRSAISETLPRVTADRASLAQAVLNLLASAIDQTPEGGAVVISAQQTDAGGIGIHVRDSSSNSTDLSERFVVFRDGTGTDGRALAPVRSSVGLALTRSLLAVNAFSLSVDPAGSKGLLFSMVIPPDLVAKP